MARVIMDDAPFQARMKLNPAAHGPTYEQQVARVREGAALVKDVATSPLTSGLVRGGQAIGQLLQDAAASRLKAKQEQRKSDANLDAAQRLQQDGDDTQQAPAAVMTPPSAEPAGDPQRELAHKMAGSGQYADPNDGKLFGGDGEPGARDAMHGLVAAAQRRLGIAPEVANAPPPDSDHNPLKYLPNQMERVADDRTRAPAGGTVMSRRGPEQTVAAPAAAPVAMPSAPPADAAPANRDTPADSAKVAAPPPAPVTLGSATDQQLDAARNKLQAALSRATPEQRSVIQQRIDAIDKQVDGRRATTEMAAAEDDRPRTVAEIHEMARMATTNEQQAKVLKLIGNARAPITSLADLISDKPQTQLMEEASKLFPTAPKRTADQDLADEQRAEWYREKSATEKAVRDGEVKKRLAQGGNLESKTKTEDALRPGKVDKLDADTGLVIEKTAGEHSRHMARDKMLQPQIDKITAETSKLNQSTASIKAKMAAIRVGRGNGVAAGSKAEKADIDAFVKMVGVHKTIVGEAKTASASANKAVSEAQSRAAAALKAASSVDAPGAKPSAPRAGSPVDLIEQYQSDLAKWELKDGAYQGVQKEKEDAAADLAMLKTLRAETLQEERDAQEIAKTVDPLIATYRGRVEKRSGTKPYAPPAEGSTYQKGGHTFKIVNGKPELVG